SHRSVRCTTPSTSAPSTLSLHDALPIFTNIARTVEELKERNIWVVGLDERGTQTYDALDYNMDCAIVLGAEGKGVSLRSPLIQRSEEHTSELQSPYDLVCRLLLEKKNLQ